MAEQDPPAARVDVSGRPGRRRKARKGKSRSSGPGTAKARPPGSAAEAGGAPREETNSDAQSSPRQSQSRPGSPRQKGSRKSSSRRGKSGRAPVARAKAAGTASSPAPELQIEPAAAADPKPAIARFSPVAPGQSLRTPYRQSYAAIDLGTNNCRLLIARPSGENFTVIDAFSRVVRLGEGLAQSGRLSEAAMDRTLAALRVCADKLMRRNVYLARSVATEACRRAENGPEFIERVRQETGIALDIISAREEARLAVLGCHVLLEEGFGPAMIFDIGGGSTELVLIESTGTVPRILDWQSVPWGVVSLTESCGPEGTTLEERLERYRIMHGLVSDSFADFAKRVSPAREGAAQTGPLRLLGTSGTVTTLASLHLELPQYDRRMVDGLIVPAESMREISSRLSSMSIEERREVNCIGRERADLVVAGCAILESILDLWPAARLGVADRGIREGILRSLIASHSASKTLAPAGHSHQLENRP
ncbi:Ppx/GppA family phosphatase [Novosphingobium aerophilum]|uniref:Ppx/GppA phosphatase family protein n=1 Tax=Novosphingobium TaxID=165696 RepID=UPI0006C8C51B|nr:Ppx/GppA phosphatase family protein [Novosphingobium sp. ST904]KPH59199.1 exopolyphosphatase [Novosphingobium sp. ST904]TCM37711.1 exopolyphosphatase/guanosine-5'-triphosphate,3'-diphosphate pyrophosphatase [Novosphingobium sp. ST904]